MEAKITKRLVDSLSTDKSRDFAWDIEIPGFGLMFTKTGAKSYVVQYRMGGRGSTTKRYTIGKHGPLTPDQARVEARRLLALVAAGTDSAAEKAASRHQNAGETVNDALALFLEKHVSTLRSKDKIKRHIEKDISPIIGDIKTTDVRKRDIIALIDRISDSGRGITSNRVFEITRKFFNWCVERDIITMSPCVGVKAQTPEQTRDRVLDDDELRRIWLASNGMGYPFGPWVMLLILTGQRRDEVAGMRWSELDLASGMWTLPKERAKNDRTHDVPLPATAMAILLSLPRTGSDFVFTTTSKTAISGFGKAKAALDAQVADDGGEPLPPWVIHDFRRTVATNLAKIGVAVHVVERLLNHVSGTIKGVAAVYNRHQYLDERRQALEAWANRLDQIINGTPANVVPIAAGRKKP